MKTKPCSKNEPSVSKPQPAANGGAGANDSHQSDNGDKVVAPFAQQTQRPQ